MTAYRLNFNQDEVALILTALAARSTDPDIDIIVSIEQQVAEQTKQPVDLALPPELFTIEDTDDDEPEGCQGHESLNGADMGVTVYCDGSCVR